MNKRSDSLILTFILFIACSLAAHAQDKTFAWPEGKQMALSLTFDDGRFSQVEGGTALLDEFGTKATFYVVPSAVEQRLEGWKKAVASGHEIGNHSLNHPCTGNFPWARQKALENYSSKQMKDELVEANKKIQQLLGVTAKQFAYPCGQKFVGRGKETKSYVPTVAELFQSGRGWLDEGPNDPQFCDFAQLTGMESDGKDFEEILLLLKQARNNNQWLVLAGHEMAEGGNQTTRLSMLRQLLAYAKDPANGIWIAPVGEVATYVSSKKGPSK
ncbi:polysaccharide deacetylase family protein [Chryseolinea sp. T2]|uniref:polysaccharide deacetylase family protein n=1 Tax=Chryseolinea sp. T2 TaxID=3129255 RepID=UPI0030776364